MEYSVKLARLPAGISFSDRLSERLRHDATRGELIYRGFMTKCAYDEVSALSDDLEYHRAVEQLFVLTSAEVSPPKGSFSPGVVVAAAAAAVMAALVVWGGVRHAAGQRTTSPPASATVSTAR